jgi:hypothetical protein
MSEPLADRLSRFTPDPGGLDRDAVLFAAGRASARPDRRWAALVAALATCQALTLVLLWPHPVSAPERLPTAAAPSSARPEARAADPTELWALNRRVLGSGREDLPPPTPGRDFTPDGPPLRAGTVPPDLLGE